MTPAANAESIAPDAGVARPGRSLALLITGSAVMQAAMMIAGTASTLLFADVFGDRWGGVPGTAGVLGTAAGVIGLTWLMRRTGRRCGLIAAYAVAGAGAGLAVVGILIQPLLVVAGLFLVGVGGAAAQLARYAGAELYPDARKGFALGAVVWGGTIGAVGGPALLSVTASVADQVGLPPLAGPFLLALLAAAVAALATIGIPRPTTPRPDREPRPTLRLLVPPGVRMAAIALIVSQVVMVALMVAAPVHMRHHGHGLGAIGTVISVHVLGMYALAPFTGYLTDRFGSRRVLTAGLLTTGGSGCALAFVTNPTGLELAAALFALGYGWNLSMVAGSALLVRGVPRHQQLRTQGAVEASVWAASAFATFSSTQILALGGYATVAAVSVALMIPALLAVVRAQPDRGPGSP
jgi:MFS family permease